MIVVVGPDDAARTGRGECRPHGSEHHADADGPGGVEHRRGATSAAWPRLKQARASVGRWESPNSLVTDEGPAIWSGSMAWVTPKTPAGTRVVTAALVPATP